MQPGLSTPKPVFFDHPEPSWKKALRQENSETISHTPQLLRGLGLCSSFGQDASEVGEATDRCGLLRAEKPVWLFLAFFLKTLRNPVQVAPVGHLQPWPMGDSSALSCPAPIPGPSPARERHRHEATLDLSSQSPCLLTCSDPWKIATL